MDAEFSAEPSDLEADEGFLTILPCRPPEGYPKPMVTWKRNEEYVNLDQRIHINDQGDLVIKKLFKEDEGRYQCIISNMAGTRDSTVARLHVRRKIFPHILLDIPRKFPFGAIIDAVLRYFALICICATIAFFALGC